MRIGKGDFRDLMVSEVFDDEDLDDLVGVNEELISEILISVISCEEFLVEDSADDREEKALKEEKIFR